jgi:hypothetical protein
MSKANTRWIVAGSLVAVAGLGLVGLRHERARQPKSDGSTADDGFQGFASRPFSARPDVASTPATADAVAREVAAAMGRWRMAIAMQDAPTVISLDQTFRQSPERYLAALDQSAETEKNERVRAFSTRVLGKLRRADQAPLFTRLLADQSPYVRQNAAWALGELGSGGALAVAELRHATARDPANDVRAAARDALDKVQ